jgi:hypothetical protein
MFFKFHEIVEFLVPLFIATNWISLILQSCILLKGIHQLLPLLMPRQFICKFAFVWGRERHSHMLGRITPTLTYILTIWALCIQSCNLGFIIIWRTLHCSLMTNVRKDIRNSYYNYVVFESFKEWHLSKCNI